MINLELKNDEDISKEIKLYQKNWGIFNVDYVISSSLVKETKDVRSNKYLSGNQQYDYFPAPDLILMSCSEFSPIHKIANIPTMSPQYQVHLFVVLTVHGQ